jgi:tRNA-splicing ligase RtcB
MTNFKLRQIDQYKWQIDPFGNMLVPAIIYANKTLIDNMDDTVFTQAANVAALPGIVRASYAMPDAHQGYGFPIGGVAAFDPEKKGVISAGGVGFDIACGVRTLHTALTEDDIIPIKEKLAQALLDNIPAGVGSTGDIKLSISQLEDALAGGAAWAVDRRFGSIEDLEYIESNGSVKHASPAKVSNKAKQRQLDQLGTLGSGNHYLEIQKVTKIYDKPAALAFGIKLGDIKISIHCGSRGLGHQIGTDYLDKMAKAATSFGIELPEKQLACAPLKSELGQSYLKAMNCGINCAMANRQIITHLLRQTLQKIIPKANCKVLYDVCHNTCRQETHKIKGKNTQLFVHRKGATRALPPGDESIPAPYRNLGQPVIIGGSMGTASYILTGIKGSDKLSFASACHGSGRSMSRKKATRSYKSKEIVNSLAARQILIRSRHIRSIAEEAPQAYKDVDQVVNTAQNAGLAKKIARLEPLICVKG